MLYGTVMVMPTIGERYVRGHEPTEKWKGKAGAKKSRIPPKKMMANACDAGENLGLVARFCRLTTVCVSRLLRRYGPIRLLPAYPHFNSA